MLHVRSQADANESGAPRTLLVAATGGHLEQLFRLHERVVPSSASVMWVTHDDAQSRSLLEGLNVLHVPYVPPRGYSELAQLVPFALRTLNRGRFDRVISTGAGIALPFFAAARLRGLRCHYIESAARADGPSATGRVASKLPGVRLYSQYPGWASERWHYQGSLFDNFSVLDVPDQPIRKVVVTLGTMRTYQFPRLLEALTEVLPTVVSSDAEVLWQVGVTDAVGLEGDVRPSVPNAELRRAISDADLVIAHAGIGSAICALELGKRPVLVPRRASRGEHVDDHQTLIARELAARDLAVSVEADSISSAVLRRAARGRIRKDPVPVPFALAR